MKKKIEYTDGLGTHERTKISSAIRQVWQRCYARRLAVKRCTREDGFQYCEKCGIKTPGAKIDHINQVGPVSEPGFIERLFCPSSGLQALCKKCHAEKTKLERKKKK